MSEDDDAREIAAFTAILIDALTHAAHTAGRAAERLEGKEGMVLFNEARTAIVRLRDDDPAMRTIITAGIPPSMFTKGNRPTHEARAKGGG